jgi:hypothetical protein
VRISQSRAWTRAVATRASIAYDALCPIAWLQARSKIVESAMQNPQLVASL